MKHDDLSLGSVVAPPSQGDRNMTWLRRGLVVGTLLFLTSCGSGQTTSYKLAQSAVPTKYQDQVFWVKASGTPDKLNRWSYYFYDPSTVHKARIVTVVDGQIQSNQPADFKTSASETLVFDPALNKVSADQALNRAKAYASDKQLKFSTVKMELRRPSSGQPPAWRISLYMDERFSGTLYLNDTDGAVVNYRSNQPKETGGEGFANDVKNTFLGIGGDLEEFFTGERTVDQ